VHGLCVHVNACLHVRKCVRMHVHVLSTDDGGVLTKLFQPGREQNVQTFATGKLAASKLHQQV